MSKIVEFLVIFLVCFVAIMIFVGISSAVSRLHKDYHNYTTPISVQHPQPGYICFLATGSDSVAISCQKE